MPITSKYSDDKVEAILSEVAAVLDKHGTGPELSLMIAGNIATNVLNQTLMLHNVKHLLKNLLRRCCLLLKKTLTRKINGQ